MTEGLIYEQINTNKEYKIKGYLGNKTNVIIPSVYKGNAVTEIDENAFSDSALISIVIPSSVTSIGYYAFSYCDNLTSVTFGENSQLTSIGSEAFYLCESLTKVNYLGTIDQWVEIEFGSSSANPMCYARTLYINDELVTDVKLTTATRINNYTFYNCTSLESIVILSSVTSIGNDAFCGCSVLTTIYCEAESKPSGWNSSWKFGCSATVVWGYKG